MLVCALLITAFAATGIFAQEVNKYDGSKDPGLSPEALTDYSFAVQSGIALEDISSGSNQLLGPGSDDQGSAVVTLGFLWRFEAQTYTFFSVNANGVMRLGPTPVGNGNTGNTTDGSLTPKFYPYWDDLCVGNSGKVHYKHVGEGIDRKLVVEWTGMKMPKAANCDGSGSGTFQVWMYEHTGVIRYVYGSNVTGSAANFGYSTGMTAVGGSFASITTAFGTISYNTNANNGQTNGILAGTSYLFTPTPVTAPGNPTVTNLTQTSLTINWTDFANNEIGYYIRRSSTGAADSYEHLGTLPTDSMSFSDSNLQPGQQYFYIVNAISNSVVSAPVTFTPTTLAPNIVTTTASGGPWNSPSTWASGSVPLSQDSVTIAPGANVTISNAAAAGSVVVSAGSNLRFGEDGAYSLTVARNVTIDAGGSFSTGNGNANQHFLSLGGNLINNGTLDFSTSNNLAGAGIRFTGAENAVFGGTGPVTDIRTITMDKGTSADSVLELNPTNFTVQGSTTDTPASGYLFLNKGMFKISGTFTGNHRTFPNPTYQVVAAAGFWLNNPNYTVAAQADTIASVLGTFRLSTGTFNVGIGGDNNMSLAVDTKFRIDGGTMNVAGRFGVTNDITPNSYIQTGGVLTVCKVGHPSASRACFDLGTFVSVGSPGPTNLMTGGEIVIQNHSPVVGAIDYRAWSNISQGTVDLSGTVLRFGNSLTNGPTEFTARGAMPNMVIDNTTSGHTVTLLANSTANSVTTTPGTRFDLFNRQFTVLGTGVVNNGTITAENASSSFVFGNSSSGDFTYSGSGVFSGVTNILVLRGNSLTFDQGSPNVRLRNLQVMQGNIINANKITLGNNDSTVNTVTFGLTNTLPPTGTLDVPPVFELGSGGQTLNYIGMPINGANRSIGPELNPSRTLRDLLYSDDGALNIGNGDLTVLNSLTLTQGRVITGSNKVIVEGAITRTNGYVEGSLKRRIGQVATYDFHVGKNGYSPASITVTALGMPSYITVTNFNEVLPGLLITNSLKRYWTVLEEGDVTARLRFTWTNNDVSGTETNYKLWIRTGGSPTVVPGTVNAVNNTIITDTDTPSFTGDWGVGESLDPSPVSISGTITTSTGNPLRFATVRISGGNLPAPVDVITGNFGTYEFTGLQAGVTYTIQAGVKRYRFNPSSVQITPTGNVTGFNFVANPQE